MPPQTQNKLWQYMPYLVSVISFLIGTYMSYLSYSIKLDALGSQISTLTTAITTLSTKQESSKELYNALDKRVSMLELKNEMKPATVSIDNDQTHK